MARSPRRWSLLASLVFKLALALVEVGRLEDVGRLFPGRVFPREEFGTNAYDLGRAALAETGG